MFKKFLLLTTFLIGTAAVHAQDNYYYAKYEGAIDRGYALDSLSKLGNVLITATSLDKLSDPVELPFDFTFYGKTVKSYKASDNGYITFDSSADASESFNDVLPDDFIAPKNAIFGLWTDLWIKPFPDAPSILTDVRSYTFGTAPHRTHVIQWMAVAPNKLIPKTNPNENWMYFAIRLYEEGGFDIIHTGNMVKTPLKATIGAQNASGTVGVMVEGSPKLNVPSSTLGDVMYKFFYKAQPENDIEMVSLSMEKYVDVINGSPVNVRIHNIGSKIVTSVDLTLEADGSTITKSFTGLNIAARGGYANITFPSNWIPKNAGQTIDVNVYVSKVNGVMDEAPANDTVSREVYVSKGLTKRRVLVEEFTSATCGPCAAQNPGFNATLSLMPKEDISVIKYQVWWPAPGNDPMYLYNQNDVRIRAGYYGVNSAPHAILDGGFYRGAPANVSTNLLQALGSRPAYYKIETTKKVDENGAYTFDVKYSSLVATPVRLIVYAAVVEDVFFDKPASTNGEKEFYSVMRKMIPNAAGTYLDIFDEGLSKTYSYKYTPDQAVKPENMHFITWVQEPTGEVYNSYYSERLSTGINEIQANSIITNLYPNPTTDVTYLEFNLEKATSVSAELMDLTGRNVLNVLNGSTLAAGSHNLKIDLSSLPKGIYILNMNANGKLYTQKLTVN